MSCLVSRLLQTSVSYLHPARWWGVGGGEAEEEQEQQGQRLLVAERSIIQRSSSFPVPQVVRQEARKTFGCRVVS